MRIQHNIMAMNAYRNYNTNTSALSKNLEKLSSGYKINRAGDDAAGLAISEKMRAQITGLNAAQKNVKDGISLVKTAEGAMQEIQDMLNRMDYLATQSANGTYDNPVDRKNLQKEVDALKKEINRIADSANFNGIKLLDGSLDPVAAKAKADAAVDAANSAAASADAASFQSVSVTAIHDHENTPEGAKMKFELDLSNLKVTSTSSGADAAVTITVAGGLTITSTADSTGNLTLALNGGATTTVAFGGASFNVTFDATSKKLTYEMVDMPTTSWSTALGAVSVQTTTYNDANFGESLEYHITQEAVVGKDPDQAQGKFDLTADMIKDGARLKIGNTEYTFAVGKDSKVDKTGANVIDLTDLNVANGTLTDDQLKIAAARLSGAANGKGDFIVTNDANSKTIHLTERQSVTGDEGYDLAGASDTTTDATWKNVVSFNPNAAPEAQEKDPNAGGNGLTLQIGDTSDTFNQLGVIIGDMHVDAMGAGTINEGQANETVITDTIDDIDISTQNGAHSAIDVIKNAINYVSGIRGDLGAVQNRLEHTANNLSVMAENIQDAESTIRDTDIAEEMMSYTKNNILVQSAQAMLAQANAVPQGVLQLLG